MGRVGRVGRVRAGQEGGSLRLPLWLGDLWGETLAPNRWGFLITLGGDRKPWGRGFLRPWAQRPRAAPSPTPAGTTPPSRDSAGLGGLPLYPPDLALGARGRGTAGVGPLRQKFRATRPTQTKICAFQSGTTDAGSDRLSPPPPPPPGYWGWRGEGGGATYWQWT